MKQTLFTLLFCTIFSISYCQPALEATGLFGDTKTGDFTIRAHRDERFPNIVMVGSGFSNFTKGYISVNGAFFKPGGALLLGSIQELPSGFLLGIKGKMICEEVQVKLHATWPDYVFAKDYKLKPLSEVETYVTKYKHLPEIPSAAEVEKDGIALGEMNEKLLKKVEELTLYLIDEQKKRVKQDKKIKELEIRLTKAEKK